MEGIEIEEIDENYAYFNDFYTLYKNLFPVKEEAETPENILKYLRLKKTDFYGKNNYHVLILKINKKISGFLIGDYYFRSGISVIEFLGIEDKYRGKSYSKILFKKFLEVVEQDSIKANAKLNGILIEVEKPEIMDNPGSFTYWDHLGFKKIECKYVQPSLSEEKGPAENLMLMYLGINEKNLKKETLLSAVEDYFKYAMFKEKPSDLKEFKTLSESIKTEYVILTKLGSTWFIHPSIHYFFNVDTSDIFSKGIDARKKFNQKLLKNIVSIGSINISNETMDDIYFRIERDRIDFSQNYLEKRYILRGSIDYKLPESIYYSPYENMSITENIPSEIKILFSYNSIGVVTIEFILNIKTTVSTGNLIYLENSGNVYLMGKSLNDFIKEILINIGLSNYPVRVNSYPLVFVKEYGGKLPPLEIYGITEIDPSYWQISPLELHRNTKKDISIVRNINVFYEYSASLVASKDLYNYIENIEEITGIQYGQIDGDAEKTALSIVEAEYAVEIERLRVQYTLLYTLFSILENKNITKRYSMEYGQLLEIQKKLVRKMDEIMLIDTERFPSLKRIFKDAQDRLGISELKGKITDLQNNIKEEIKIRSEVAQTLRTNILNILIFILIVIQIFEPYLMKEYAYVIYAIVIIAGLSLIYSFIFKK